MHILGGHVPSRHTGHTYLFPANTGGRKVRLLLIIIIIIIIIFIIMLSRACSDATCVFATCTRTHTHVTHTHTLTHTQEEACQERVVQSAEHRYTSQIGRKKTRKLSLSTARNYRDAATKQGKAPGASRCNILKKLRGEHCFFFLT